MLDESLDAVEGNSSVTSKSQKTEEKIIRKIICRYGRGCTHIHDIVHKERFWHPPVPQLNPDQIRTHYICYECGNAFSSLSELQFHLQRKTAWSNSSLIGCRISCLVANREWQEAFVLQFHKSGKHYVELRNTGEKRWFNMTKVAFYIIERPFSKDSNEIKEDDIVDSLSKESWTFFEEMTLDYAFAQSVLCKITGTNIQETGHKTKGHICVTDEDKDNARNHKGSLLYGELLPRGVNKALGSKHLKATTARTLFDLGMGTGKVVIQAFLQFRNLEYVYGVELSAGRFALAEETALRMLALLGKSSFELERVPGVSITITEKPGEKEGVCRVLKMENGDMMDVTDINIADIVMLETDIPAEHIGDMCCLLSQMKPGSRTLTYLDLRKIWPTDMFPFMQLAINLNVNDRFPTSWTVQRGHHFFLWYASSPVSISYGGSERIVYKDECGGARGGSNKNMPQNGITATLENTNLRPRNDSSFLDEYEQLSSDDNEVEGYDDDFNPDHSNVPGGKLTRSAASSSKGQRGMSSFSPSSVGWARGGQNSNNGQRSPNDSFPSTTEIDSNLKLSVCLPFSFLGVCRGKKKQKKTDHENEKVIPVNTDGTRSVSPRLSQAKNSDSDYKNAVRGNTAPSEKAPNTSLKQQKSLRHFGNEADVGQIHTMDQFALSSLRNIDISTSPRVIHSGGEEAPSAVQFTPDKRNSRENADGMLTPQSMQSNRANNRVKQPQDADQQGCVVS